MFEISPLLAEETGAFIGDGFLSKSKSRGSYTIGYVGNVKEEKIYFSKFLPKLIESIYGITPKVRIEPNVCRVLIYSKEVGEFKHKVLGFPIGKKSDIVQIPKKLLDAGPTIINPLLRGYFDTDGFIHFLRKKRDKHYYPKISVRSASSKLIKQCAGILKGMGFNLYVNYDLPNGYNKAFKISRLEISGQKNFEKWMREIGSNNERNITKYLVWKKFGYCPSHTTTEQRKSMINQGKVAEIA